MNRSCESWKATLNLGSDSTAVATCFLTLYSRGLRAPCLDPLESDSQLRLRLYGSGQLFSDTLFPWARAPCLDPRQDKKYSATIVRASTPTCCWRWGPITVQLSAAKRLQFPTCGHVTSHTKKLIRRSILASPPRRSLPRTLLQSLWWYQLQTLVSLQLTAGAEQTKLKLK
jgi:hypothetical protein